MSSDSSAVSWYVSIEVIYGWPRTLSPSHIYTLLLYGFISVQLRYCNSCMLCSDVRDVSIYKGLTSNHYTTIYVPT